MRHQSSSAFAYFFRNFWHYIYIVLPVVVFMSIFANFTSETQFFYAWAQGQLTQENYISQMMNGMLFVNHVDQWWQGIVTYVLVAVTFSLLAVKISRHMRIGGFVLLPFKSAFKVMPAMFVFCGCFALLVLALEFVAFGIMYILRSFFVMNVVIAVGLVLLWLAKVIVVYIWMLLLLCFPLSFDENYPFNVALSYSVREMSKHQGLCIGSALIYATIYALIVFLDYVVPFPIAHNILYGVFFAIVIYLVPVLAFTIHHQSLGSERKDISRPLMW